MTTAAYLSIILAAGQGTRMNSRHPKVMHKIAGLPMIGHVLGAVEKAKCNRVAVVVGPDMDELSSYVKSCNESAGIHLQEERLGTGHAVLAARKDLANNPDKVVVLYGDTPFVKPSTITAMLDVLDEGADVVVLGFEPETPGRYGRLVLKNDQVVAIREAKDASPAELGITLCNAGIMAFSGRNGLSLLDEIDNKNVQKEFYLTDLPEIATRRGLSVRSILADEQDVMGINSRIELANAESIFQSRYRKKVMQNGVTLQAPDTVYFSHDTQISSDVTIEPHVYFGPDVTVHSNAVIRAFSHIEGALISEFAVIGPYARLRPGTNIGEHAKVGNFSEIKKSKIGAGAKVNHLSYIGDADIGAGANIGAGTITCNYDGFGKFKTRIGKNAFIGSNTSLVAPVLIGEGAYVGSGSVITKDIPQDALAVARGKQSNIKGWASLFRTKYKKETGR